MDPYSKLFGDLPPPEKAAHAVKLTLVDVLIVAVLVWWIL